jgi:hypothetical protein
VRTGRPASRGRHVCVVLLMFALWPGIAPAIEQDSITNHPDWEMSAWSRSYIDGLDAAKKENWKEALTRFKQAFNEQRTVDPKFHQYADAPQIWYNLAFTMTRFPGHELRAAALFSAYLVKYPHSPQRDGIIKQIDQLLSKLDGRIELLRKEEERQYRNIYKEYKKTSDESKMGGAILAKRFAEQGDLPMAERHAARFEEWFEKNRGRLENEQDQLENHGRGSYEWTDVLRARVGMYESLIDAHVIRHNRNLAKGRDIKEDLTKARFYYDKIAKVNSESAAKYPKSLFYIPFHGGPARFMACDARRNGYDFSMESAKNDILRHVRTESRRDQEMVRFGIVEYRLRDFEKAENTFRLIGDDVLRNRWLLATKGRKPLTPAQILGGFRKSKDWFLGGLREIAGEETEENPAIACLDSNLEKERLLNVASMGIDLLACSVFLEERKIGEYPAPREARDTSNGDVPASDLNVEKCLIQLSKSGLRPSLGAEAYPGAIGTIADAFSRGKSLIRRYSEMYEAFP